jgi:hypothetical protein
MDREVAGALATLGRLGSQMAAEVRGRRLVDLALGAIEIIDRNLYERTCDVRWWATDAAVVQALETPGPATAAHAARRLGVILDAYSVYLDLWIADREGRIVAHGRPGRYPGVIGQSVADASWFASGLSTRTGDEYAVGEIGVEPALGKAFTATYSTAIRRGGEARGEPLGVLGIHFDWGPQAQAVVKGVRLSPAERDRTRVLLIDAQKRVIAASNGQGILTESVPSGLFENESGFHPRRRIPRLGLPPHPRLRNLSRAWLVWRHRAGGGEGIRKECGEAAPPAPTGTLRWRSSQAHGARLPTR